LDMQRPGHSSHSVKCSWGSNKASTKIRNWPYTITHSDRLKGWTSGEGITYEAPREFQNLVDAQKKIGGSRFFEGWLVEYWATIQQRYNSIIRSSRTGQCWAIAIIQKFWDTAWDMWDNRNGILHETENIVTITMGIHLNQKVSRIYTDLRSRPLRSLNCHLVRIPLSTLLRKDTKYKATWLAVPSPHWERVDTGYDNAGVEQNVWSMACKGLCFPGFAKSSVTKSCRVNLRAGKLFWSYYWVTTVVTGDVKALRALVKLIIYELLLLSLLLVCAGSLLFIFLIEGVRQTIC
jgi:hypothetical protein